MIAERRDVAAEGLQAGLLRLQEWPGMESGRLATGPMATTPRSIVAPAPIKRKHLALRSPRGGFDTTPRAATERAATKVPAPPMQPREAGTQASASGRSCATGSTRRSTARRCLRSSTQRSPKRSAPGSLHRCPPFSAPLRCAARGHPVTPVFLCAGAAGAGRPGRLARHGGDVQRGADGSDAGAPLF